MTEPAMDVSASLSDSASLEESRAILAAIVENTNDAIVGKRLDGAITVWNQAAEKLFGYTAAEIIGQAVNVLIPPERLSEETYVIDRLRRGLAIDHYRSIRRTKDGRLINVSLTISPIRDANGAIFGASVIARDITQQIKTERALRESESRFRQLADSLPQIVWEANAAGQIDYYNRRWYEYTGLAELDGPLAEAYQLPAIHPDDLHHTSRQWMEAVKAGRPHLHETRLRNGATGIYRWHLIRSVPVRNEKGQIIRWFGTNTDIDDLKRTEERAKDQQNALAHMERIRTMGQMAAGLAHELNQPLGAILNYGVALQCSLKGDAKLTSLPDAKGILGEIVSQSVRAGEIIRRMRTFVKKQQLLVRAMDINALILESMQMLAFDLRQGHLDPTLRLADGLPPVMVDQIQIQQVLVNLIRNGIDSMSAVPPSDRRLIISTEKSGDGMVTINVIDGGCGVSPDNLHKIFDSFFTTKQTGMGMGLALCRTILEDHGGHLSAHANVDYGTTFSFSVKEAHNGK
ncbi:MAG: hypothetical protein JWM57_2492 [Phycisphaerales bacterium]|nr:hypothetical protein [Phycisphaerales bacterium]